MKFLVALAAMLAATAPARAGERIVFATDWKAQAEQGGFYQALAEGLYAARGLDVQIRQGGPAVNVPQLIAAGAVDFGLGSNSFIPMNMVEAGAPVRAVMASFQKDPQVLITHKRSDVKSLADLKGKPIMVSDAAIGAYWGWLRAKYGFDDSQIRKYTNNLAPFLVNPKAVQQGYITSEPFLITRETKEEPQLFLLADNGYPSYGALVLVPDSWIAKKPKLVQAFVDATILGWQHYLRGDPKAGNARIKADNPEMTDDVLAQAIEKMRAYHLVEGDDGHIGEMTDARWKDFFNVMSAQGVYPKTLDYKKAYTLSFVSAKVTP